MVLGVRCRILPVVLVVVAAVASLSAPAAAQKASPRIIGGGEVPITSYPYQVRVLISGVAGFTEGQCGGSVRDATHIVTAAHCVTDDLVVTRTPTAPGNVRVRYGSADAATQSEAGVSAVTVASRYLALDDNYDAALLTLSQPLGNYGGPGVNRIPFASAAELAAAVNGGQSAVATGFGVTSNGGTNTSPRLKAVSLPLRLDSACTDYYGPGAYSPPLAVCAGGAGSAPANNADTCQGDSGGPLAISAGGVLKLAGITSRGDQCGQPGVPAVYTEASNPEICGLLGGGAECTTGSAAPAAPAPVRRAVTPDRTRPRARVTLAKCKRRRCTFHVRTRDNARVKSIRMRVYRNVRKCKQVRAETRCRTVKRSRKLRPRRIRGGYSAKAKLYVARYRLDAIAVDSSRNRSLTARKRFKVKRR